MPARLLTPENTLWLLVAALGLWLLIQLGPILSPFLMAAILAYRISRIRPITFSFAMNDYGFELLSDQPIPVDDSNVYELFSTDNLLADIQRSVNSTEMARRKFRDIAVIGGLIFQGYPGEQKKARHLQSSASLLFKVFSEYEKDNLDTIEKLKREKKVELNKINGALRQKRERVLHDFTREAEQVQVLFNRVGRRYSFGPFPLVWHRAVWQSLDELVQS